MLRRCRSVLSRLIGHEANLQSRGGCGQKARYLNIDMSITTPLMEAILCKDAFIVKQMLEDGVDVNQESNHRSPLVLATQLSSIEIMSDLILAGANIHGSEMGNSTPLRTSVIYFLALDDWGPYDLLIKSGADPSVRSGSNRHTIPEQLAIIGQYGRINDLIDRGYRRDLNFLLELLRGPNAEHSSNRILLIQRVEALISDTMQTK